MKVLISILYKTLLYTAPVWVFYFYLEYRLSHIENSYSYKIRNFKAIEPDCELLVLGNSQMLKGVNPGFLPANAYNMANVSQTLPLDEAILKQYISRLPRLKTVVIGLCYTSFGEDLETGEEAWRLSFYKKYYGVSIHNKFELKEYSNTLRYMPYESLKMCLKNFKVDLIKGYQPNGWMKVDGTDSFKNTGEWARQRALMHTKSLNDINITKNVNALKSIIRLLTNEHIEIVLVSPPVQSNYYTNLNADWLAKNDSILGTITKQYGLKLLDFSKTESNEFINGFNDADHLNEKGAEILSRLIGKSVSE